MVVVGGRFVPQSGSEISRTQIVGLTSTDQLCWLDSTRLMMCDDRESQQHVKHLLAKKLDIVQDSGFSLVPLSSGVRSKYHVDI